MPKQRIESAANFDDDGNIVSGVGAGVGKTFIRKYFPRARHIIRVASAYFRLTGYKIARAEINPDVRLHVLVGHSEIFYVKETLVKEILREFGQCETELHETVKDLVERIKRGDFIIRDARAMQTKFHCKFYICDNTLLWHGSANFTYSGLRTNAEQVSLIRDKRQIESFSNWYDAVSKNALDVLNELLTELEKWLGLSAPFEIYLKTLFLLNNLPYEPLGEGAHQPMNFQKGVIAQSLRQIEDYGGSLIVAATGLGKTIIGAEIALRLRKPGIIKRVIIIAPQIVHQNWESELKGRDINFDIFNSDVLFLPESEISHHKVRKLDNELKRADVETLIVVDEAHVFRNELLAENTKKRHSRVYTRLVEVVKAGAKIVLLTATAYGTNALNFNSLLFLLPHGNRKKSLHKSKLPVQRAWEATTPEEFADLPVVSVLGLPHVLKMAQERGDIDNGRVFIRFAENQKFYLPKTLALRSVRFDLSEREQLQAAFDAGCFNQARKKAYPFYDDDEGKILRGLVDTIYNTSLFGWLGSPLSIKDAIEKNLTTPDNQKTDLLENSTSNNIQQLELFLESEKNNEIALSQKTEHPYFDHVGYKLSMQLDYWRRREILSPILVELDKSSDSADEKFHRLKEILEIYCEQKNGKVLIFVKRHMTACYLEKMIKRTFADKFSLGCTVKSCGSSPELKSLQQRAAELKRFSPISHGHRAESEHDILICTDADGVGVNLQDANVIVNYDPPLAADVLFQRVGRILRMTKNSERIVSIYTFAPSIIDEDNDNSPVQQTIQTIYRRLNLRHEKSKRILGSGVLSLEEDLDATIIEEDIDVDDLIKQTVLLPDAAGLRAEIRLRHTETLQQNIKEANELPDWMLSARGYDNPQMRFFVLLKHGDKYKPVMFKLSNESPTDLSKGEFEPLDNFEIFDLLICEKTEKRAAVNGATVELLANLVVENWCRQQPHEITTDTVTKVCGVWLVPNNLANDVNNLFKDFKRDNVNYTKRKRNS